MRTEYADCVWNGLNPAIGRIDVSVVNASSGSVKVGSLAHWSGNADCISPIISDYRNTCLDTSRRKNDTPYYAFIREVICWSYIVREEWSYCREVVYLNFTVKKNSGTQITRNRLLSATSRYRSSHVSFAPWRHDFFTWKKNKIHSPNREEKFYSWPAKRQLFLARLGSVNSETRLWIRHYF